MAQAPRRTRVTVDDQWVCTLSATPDQVRAGDRLTSKVTLSNPVFDGLSGVNQSTVYSDGFSYSYSSSNDILNARLSLIDQTESTTITFPDIPDGDYGIDVAVVVKDSAVLSS